MTVFTDEMLSAYLDGEADEAVAAQIEQAAGEDPALAARLEAMAAGDDALRGAAEAMLGPVPASMTQALEAPRSAEVLAFRPRPARPAISGHWMQVAAAGVAALVIGGVGGSMLTPRQQPLVSGAGPELAANARLAEALSTTRSGEDAQVAGGTMKVALSFRAKDGRLCRQFDLTTREAGAAGVACRDKDRWRIEGWTSGPSAAATGYQTAGGPDEAAITAIADRLGVAETLDADGESRAMRSGWAR